MVRPFRRFLLAKMILFFLISGSALAGVTIVSPQKGAYVSGANDIVLKIDGEATLTRLFIDGKMVFQMEGRIERFTYDFGEDILRREIRAEIEDPSGKVVTSDFLITRALSIDYTDTTRLVLLGAVVKTRSGKPVLGLIQDDFRVFENNKSLEIQSFYKESLPLDLVILLDTSSSLRDGGIDDVKRGAIAFISKLAPSDRVALFEFKKKPVLLADFTTDRARLTQMIQGMEPLGETALFNALHLGLDHLQGRRKGRKALLLFTDGRDSYYDDPRDKARMMRNAIVLAQNREVTIFTLGLGEKVHKAALTRIAEETGGRFYAADRPSRLGDTFHEILYDLKHQYMLGVTPKATGKGFQKIEIKVKKRGAVVHARKGYTRE